jgi:hypothetical protein
MAVAYKMVFEGGTLEQYNQVMELMGLTGDAEAPEGAIFHWAAPHEKGLIVVDVWETDEQFNEFAESKIGPYSAQAGIPGPPKTTRFEVHNMLAGNVAATA